MTLLRNKMALSRSSQQPHHEPISLSRENGEGLCRPTGTLCIAVTSSEGSKMEQVPLHGVEDSKQTVPFILHDPAEE